MIATTKPRSRRRRPGGDWILCRGIYTQVLSPVDEWVCLPEYARTFDSFPELVTWCRANYEFALRGEVYVDRLPHWRERNRWAPQWSAIFRRYLLHVGTDW